ncbi:hypothetical protein PHYBOEH_002900 [Phytophthora boehmeriae]|uniref:Uncharacterized protein n=1 Tax=Phytophthora boehmeriae TaxID=109152 RepID=A0A8T1WTL7_9STRA|nr:hypothetical protein PHYBOEH_002900 [Phytophthora boehmeriae]
MLKQWRLIVDGLQNLELKLLRMDENTLSADISEWLCYWRVVGVRSVRVQRDGVVDATAISGTTRVRFHGLRVQEISVGILRREDRVRYGEFAQCSHDANDSGDSDRLPIVAASSTYL